MTQPTNTPPNPPNPPAAPPAAADAMPTLAQLQDLAGRAAEAVSQATNAAEAANAAATALRERASQLNLQIPDDVITTISDQAASAVIAQLRAVGALTNDDGAGGAHPPAPIPPGGPPAPSPPADPPGGPRRTFAQKFLGQ